MSPPSEGWRHPILAHFTPDATGAARLTVVIDPDDLLAEPGISAAIREQGFEAISLDDPIEFRFAYEQRFRALWDAGEAANLVVVWRGPATAVDSLPFDILAEARRQARVVAVGLADLFPALAPQVVTEMGPGELDALYRAVQAYQPEPLGENAARDFVLRHVYEIAPELIKSPVDLLRVLLRLHYSDRLLPPSLASRLVGLLGAQPCWSEWPLADLTGDRRWFMEFLAERWPFFVRDRLGASVAGVAEPPAAYALRHPGPRLLPFDHDDIRVYVDNLFVEGLLAPTRLVTRQAVRGTWMEIGVSGDAISDQVDRLRRLLELLTAEFPAPATDHHAWLQTAQRWAELAATRWALPTASLVPDLPRIETMHDRLERAFEDWLASRYTSLHSLPSWPRPVMGHHVPHFLAHGSVGAATRGKKALVVIDGLALDQWVTIRPALMSPAWTLHESALFAWVPTITAVSRQALLAGVPPFFLGAKLGTSPGEEAAWGRFWEGRGLPKGAATFVNQKHQEAPETFVDRVRDRVEHPKTRMIAVVVGTVDMVLHGGVAGTAGLHATLRHWAPTGPLPALVALLVGAGYEVFITADHGNVEARGIGKPAVGATADERGERVHIFRDDLLRRQTATGFPGSISWPPAMGLPTDYLPLIAPARRAFITADAVTVAHGGLCLEEVVVPFVRIAGTR